MFTVESGVFFTRRVGHPPFPIMLGRLRLGVATSRVMMSTYVRVPAHGPWADLAKCSRAVRVGDTVHVSGTCAMGETPTEQVKAIFGVIEPALKEAGATLDDVVITRMFAADVKSDWQELGAAHGEIFADTKPACTLVGAELLADWYASPAPLNVCACLGEPTLAFKEWLFQLEKHRALPLLAVHSTMSARVPLCLFVVGCALAG